MTDEIAKPTFEKWLKKQKKREDPVGDLAKDFIQCKKCCHREVESVEESMSLHDPCLDALNAYKIAVSEYTEQYSM